MVRAAVSGSQLGHELVVEHRQQAVPHSIAERVSGALVPLLGAILRDAERGYLAMNEALKAWAEAGPDPPPR